MLMSAMRGEMLTPNPKSAILRKRVELVGAQPTCTIYTGGGGQLPYPKSAILC